MARFVDPNIDQLVVVAAGIGRGGTVAAGEFLVDSQRMDEMLKEVPDRLEAQKYRNRTGNAGHWRSLRPSAG